MRSKDKTSRWKILASFQKSKDIFFCKTMKISMVTERFSARGWAKHDLRLEIPAPFVCEHGDKFHGEEVTLVRPDCTSAWSVVLTRRIWGGKNRTFFRGGSWEHFVLGNQIDIGDFLVFSLIEMSRFMVRVYPIGKKIQKRPRVQAVEKATGSLTSDDSRSVGLLPSLNERFGWSKADALDILLTPIEELHTNPEEADMEVSDPRRRFYEDLDPPYFVKVMSHMHGSFSKRPRLRIPADFVRAHGKELRAAVKLEVPSSPQVMKVTCFKCHDEQTKVRTCLGAGWKDFYKENKFEEGDKLLFSLIGPSHFFVQILQSHSESERDIQKKGKKVS